jgi:hypothetical protein
MSTLPVATLDIIRYLQSNNIDPLLYGSQGVSLYLGAYKDDFCDVDLLIPEVWITDKWSDLILIMSKNGFELVNEHEHEFNNNSGVAVGFASETILIRDGITQSLDNIVVTMKVKDVDIRTLDLCAFKSAYEFSVKDGYRKHNRNKKDQNVIDLINQLARNV